MNIPVNIEIPQIWPGTFSKNEWNSVNFIVGANGTGKSLFSNSLKNNFNAKDLRLDYCLQNDYLASRRNHIRILPPAK